MSKARAEIEVTASASKLAAGLNAARARFNEFSSSVARGTAATFKNAMAGLGKMKLPSAGRALGNFAGDMMTRGLDAVVDAGNGVRNFERDLTRLGITAKRTPEQLNAIRESFRTTSVATGIDSGKIAAASRVYFDLTSDAENVAQAMDDLSHVAQASDSSLEDIIKTAAALRDSMNIKPDEMLSVFSGLIESGNAGKIGLKDMGAELPSLLAMFQKFKGSGRDGVMQMAAAFQVGAKAFGSSSQAATGLEAMMGMLNARQSQLAAAGVKVYEVNRNGTVTLRNLHAIVSDIAKAKIDPRKFGKIFGENKEGRNFLEMLMKYPDLYNDIMVATEQTGSVQRDFNAMMESDSGRVDAALNRVKETVAEAFTPERIEAFVGILEMAAEAIGTVIDGLAEIKDHITGKAKAKANPFSVADQVEEDRGGFWDDFAVQDIFVNPAIRHEQERMAAEGVRQTGVGMKGATGDKFRDMATNEKAFDEAMSKIETAGPRSKKIRTAVEASYGDSYSSDPNAMSSPGRRGRQAAGERYLAAEGVDQAKIDAIKGELQAKAYVEIMIPKITDAITKGFASAGKPTVQIGDNQVARSVNKATTARTAP
jgi:hypothetical protein